MERKIVIVGQGGTTLSKAIQTILTNQARAQIAKEEQPNNYDIIRDDGSEC